MILRSNPELWVGCVAGAMQESEYKSELAAAGFADIGIEPTRVFRAEDVREFLSAAGAEAVSVADQAGWKDHERLCARHKARQRRGQIQGKGELYPRFRSWERGAQGAGNSPANVEKAVQGLGLEARVEKVTEIEEILKFQILMTPGLVINGQVKAAGRIPPVEEIMQMLATAGGN